MTQQQQQANLVEYLTVQQVADELGFSYEFARQLCISGELRSADFGTGSRKVRRVRREWLEEFRRQRESMLERAAGFSASRPAASSTRFVWPELPAGVVGRVR